MHCCLRGNFGNKMAVSMVLYPQCLLSSISKPLFQTRHGAVQHGPAVFPFIQSPFERRLKTFSRQIYRTQSGWIPLLNINFLRQETRFADLTIFLCDFKVDRRQKLFRKKLGKANFMSFNLSILITDRDSSRSSNVSKIDLPNLKYICGTTEVGLRKFVVYARYKPRKGDICI